jgi:carbonic anhydrase/acetyltransferase-like protein (isoleucine patch superfamily)
MGVVLNTKRQQMGEWIMPIYALGNKVPFIDPTAFVHPDAVVIGDVQVGAHSSIWPSAVLRADSGRIVIGSGTSIQDGSVIHCTASHNTVIGDNCVIGHGVHLEGCRIESGSLIGSHAVVLHNAVVGPTSLVGACALVGNNKVVPPNARALGVPATITEGVITSADIEPSAQIYVNNASWYSENLRLLE